MFTERIIGLVCLDRSLQSTGSLMYYYYFKAFLCDNNKYIPLFDTQRHNTKRITKRQKNIYYKSSKKIQTCITRKNHTIQFKRNTVINQQTTNTIQIKIVAITGSMRSGWAVHLFYQRWSTVFLPREFYDILDD